MLHLRCRIGFWNFLDPQTLLKRQTMRAVMGIFDQRATIASSLSDTDSIVQSLESGFAGAARTSGTAPGRHVPLHFSQLPRS